MMPASKLAHRALISLIPAFSLAFVAVDAGTWYLMVPVLFLAGLGVYYLSRAAKQLDRERESSH